MELHDFIRGEPPDFIPFCPACGASNFADRHIHPQMRRELEREADGLVQEGRTVEAVELLTALYARHIAAIVRPRWLCRSCGVKFDG